MEALGKFVNSISSAIEFNKATLSGCVDVIVVRQPDGSLKSTPFHVRFGKLKLLKCKDCPVSISVNSNQTDLKMILGEAGEGFFEEGTTISDAKIHHPQEKETRQKAKSDKSLAPIKIDNRDNMMNSKLLNALELKLSSSTCSDKTKADSQASDVNANFENENQKASDFIFSDDVQPIILPSKQSSVTSHEKLHRSHSASEIPDIKIQETTTKTLRPTSRQLESLNLQIGMNHITYTVKSNLQGTQTIVGNIYLWTYDSNIIISDIDGTITKSDVMGHLMSMAKRDWSQPGIAPLYTNIRRNGYHLMYLTSRAIGQADQTREFLNSVQQDGKMLPLGPLITSPDRLLPSVKREIIFKRPEIFKMAVLKDIRNLFPADHNPFHAGFGNRETDAIAYKSVGVPLEKVFIVNPKGDIHHHNHNGISKSYAMINTMIKEIFPGIVKNSKTRLLEKIDSENALNLKDEELMQSNLIKVIS